MVLRNGDGGLGMEIKEVDGEVLVLDAMNDDLKKSAQEVSRHGWTRNDIEMARSVLNSNDTV